MMVGVIVVVVMVAGVIVVVVGVMVMGGNVKGLTHTNCLDEIVF